MRHRKALADFDNPERYDLMEEALIHIEACGRCRGQVAPDELDFHAIWEGIVSQLGEAVPAPPLAAKIRGLGVTVASVLAVVLFGLIPVLLLVGPPPGGPSGPIGSLEEDPFLASDPHAQQGWLDANEPGVASLYDGGPHVLHSWSDHWSILAGYYEGSLCYEARSIHGGVAGCERELSEPWAVPGVFSAIAGISIRLEDEVWAAYGTGTAFGLTSREVARVELAFERGATVAIRTLGRTDATGFAAYGHSYAIDDVGRLIRVTAYDDQDSVLGEFDFSSDGCQVFDSRRGLGIQVVTVDGTDVSPRRHDLLLVGSTHGCGFGFGTDMGLDQP